MTQRLAYHQASPNAFKAMMALETATHNLSIPTPLRELVKMRVSQINGCAYCLNMHAPEARDAGISQQKLDVLAGWRDSPIFDTRERAALGWAEAITRLEASHVPDSDYLAMREAFSDEECADLTLVINTINSWNRFAVGFRSLHPTRRGG